MCDIRRVIWLLLAFAIAITNVLAINNHGSDYSRDSSIRDENAQSSQNTPKWSHFFVMHEPRMQPTNEKNGFFYQVGNHQSADRPISNTNNYAQPSHHYKLLNDESNTDSNHRNSFDQINSNKFQPPTETNIHQISSQVRIPIPGRQQFIRRKETSISPEYSLESFTDEHIVRKTPEFRTLNGASVPADEIENKPSGSGSQSPKDIEGISRGRNQNNPRDQLRRRRLRRPSHGHTSIINNANRRRRPSISRDSSFTTNYPSNASEIHGVHGALVEDTVKETLEPFQKPSISRHIHNGRINHTNRRRNSSTISNKSRLQAQALISNPESSPPASHTIRLNRRRPFNPSRTTKSSQTLKKNADKLHAGEHPTPAVEPQWDEDNYNQTSFTARAKPNITRNRKRVPVQSHAVSTRRQGSRRPRINRQKNSTNTEFLDSMQIRSNDFKHQDLNANIPVQTESVPKSEMEPLGSHVHMTVPETQNMNNARKPILRTAFGIRLKASNSTDLNRNEKRGSVYLGSQESEISITTKEYPPKDNINQRQGQVSRQRPGNQIPRRNYLHGNKNALLLKSSISEYDEGAAHDKEINDFHPSSHIREINSDDVLIIPPTVIEEESDIKPYRDSRFHSANSNQPDVQDNSRYQNNFFNKEGNVNPKYRIEQYGHSRRKIIPVSNEQSSNLPSHSFNIYPQMYQPKLKPTHNIKPTSTRDTFSLKDEISNEPIINYQPFDIMNSQVVSETTTTSNFPESSKIIVSQPTETGKERNKNTENHFPRAPEKHQTTKILTSHQTNILRGPSIQHGFVHTQLQLPPLNFRFHLTPVHENMSTSLVAGTYHGYQSDPVISSSHYRPPIPYQHAPIHPEHTISNNQYQSNIYNHPFQYQPPVLPYQKVHHPRLPIHSSQPNVPEMHHPLENFQPSNGQNSEYSDNEKYNVNTDPHGLPLNNEQISGTLRSKSANENSFLGTTAENMRDINTSWQPAVNNDEFNSHHITLYLRNLNPILPDQPENDDHLTLKNNEDKTTTVKPSVLQLSERLEKALNDETAKPSVVVSSENVSSLSMMKEENFTIIDRKPISINRNEANSTDNGTNVIADISEIAIGSEEFSPTLHGLVNDASKEQNISQSYEFTSEKRRKVNQSSTTFVTKHVTSSFIIDGMSTDQPTNAVENLKEVNTNHSTVFERKSNFLRKSSDLESSNLSTTSKPWTNTTTKNSTASLLTNSKETSESTTSVSSNFSHTLKFETMNITNFSSDVLTNTPSSTLNATNILQNLDSEIITSPFTTEIKTVISPSTSNKNSILQPTPPTQYNEKFPLQDEESDPTSLSPINKSDTPLSDTNEKSTSTSSFNKPTTSFHIESAVELTENPIAFSKTFREEIKENLENLTTDTNLNNSTNVATNSLPNVAINTLPIAAKGLTLKNRSLELIENENDTTLLDGVNSTLPVSTMITTEPLSIIQNFNGENTTHIEMKTSRADSQNVSVSALKEISDMEMPITKPSEVSNNTPNKKVIFDNPTVMDFSKITSSPAQPKRNIIHKFGNLKIPSDVSVFMFTEIPINKKHFSPSVIDGGIHRISKPNKTINNLSNDQKDITNISNVNNTSNNAKNTSDSTITTIISNTRKINKSENLTSVNELLKGNLTNDILKLATTSADKISTLSSLNSNTKPSTFLSTDEDISSTEFNALSTIYRVNNTNEHLAITESSFDLKTEKPSTSTGSGNLLARILETVITTVSVPSEFATIANTVSNFSNTPPVTSFTDIDKNASDKLNNFTIIKNARKFNVTNKINDVFEKETTPSTGNLEPSGILQIKKTEVAEKITETPCNVTRLPIATRSKNNERNSKRLNIHEPDLEVSKEEVNVTAAPERITINNNSQFLADNTTLNHALAPSILLKPSSVDSDEPPLLVSEFNSSSSNTDGGEKIPVTDTLTTIPLTTEKSSFLTKTVPVISPTTNEGSVLSAETTTSPQELHEISTSNSSIFETTAKIKEITSVATNLHNGSTRESQQIGLSTTVLPNQKLVPTSPDCGSIEESDPLKKSINKTNNNETLLITSNKTS